MSHHKLKSKVPTRAVVAGWSAPDNTFYFTVTDINPASRQPGQALVQVGQKPGEYPNVDIFLKTLAPHADIPQAFRARLLKDREDEPHDPASLAAEFADILGRKQQSDG